MSALVAVVGSLAGVVIGAGLSSWLQGRTEVRRVFWEAIAALARVAAAQNYPSKTSTSGVYDPVASADLQRRMHDEFVSSLLEARRALTVVYPHCPEIRPYLSAWMDVQSAETQVALERILRRGLGRSLRMPFR